LPPRGCPSILAVTFDMGDLMSQTWWNVIIAGGAAGGATFFGMILILVRPAWSRHHSGKLISYAAGVLLGVGFLHIIPESMELSGNAPFYLVLSFILFYFLEHHLFFHASHEELHHSGLELRGSHDACCENPHPMGAVAFFGMTLHSVIDGLVIGSGYEADPGIGFLSALGVIAHEVPEGIVMLSILLHYGYSTRRAVIFTALVALATPAGAVGAYALVRDIELSSLGNLMALAGGSFIYIAASDLIPESHRVRGLRGSLFLCAGILSAYAAGVLAH